MRPCSVLMCALSLSLMGQAIILAQSPVKKAEEARLTPQQSAQLTDSERLHSKATELFQKGSVKEAIVLEIAVLATVQTILGEEHPSTIVLLINLGAMETARQNYVVAQPHLEQALKLSRKIHGNESHEVMMSLNNLGGMFQKKGDYAVAQPYFEEELEILKKVRGDEHLATAVSLNNLGQVAIYKGDFKAARSHLEEALRIRKKHLRGDHPDIARSLHNLGMLLVDLNDYGAARAHLDQALKIRQSILDSNHPDIANSLNCLGGVADALGDFETARTYYEQALKIRRKAFGDKHPDTARSINNMGLFLFGQGDLAGARNYYEESLKIRREVLGETHPETATSLNNMAGILHEMGDYATARSYYEQALIIQKKFPRERQLDTAKTLNNYSRTLMHLKDVASARSCCLRALLIARELNEGENEMVATCLQDLGRIHMVQSDCASAEACFKESLTIFQKLLGNEHPDVADLMSSLGMALNGQGKRSAARSLFQEALKIDERAYGDNHPQTRACIANLAAVESALGNWDVAGRLQDLVRRGDHRDTIRVLPSLTEREQLAFIWKERPSLHMGYTLGWQHRNEADLATRSGAWLLNGKGLSHAALAERISLASQTRDPKVAEFARRLLQVRQQLAQISMSVPRPDQVTARQQRIDTLIDEDDRLTRQLAKLNGHSGSKEWIELEAVRRALPADSCLIEFSRFAPFDFAALWTEKQWQPDRFVAWIIPPAGSRSVQVVDLGEAEPIEKLISQLREMIQRDAGVGGTLTQQGERAAVAKMNGPLSALAECIWIPLREHVADAKTLILSPDASLWLVPWGALPGKGQGRFLIEDLDLRYVLSGRELVEHEVSKGRPNAPVIFANPQFDDDPTQVQRTLKSIDRGAWLEELKSVGASALSNKRLLPKVELLPGTAREAQAIQPNLAKFAQTEPHIYLGPQALESVFKAVRRPRIAVLSTHGFFLPDQETKQTDHLLAASSRGIPMKLDAKIIENPLVRCGLLFAGCNDPRAGEGSGDDGVLTGLEIVGIDLHGTELVVLSACETGVGQVRNGDGVAGLRQAFQLAGAEAVIATLWQIPDVQSARLMADFFTNLTVGQSKTDALRNAQMKMIEYRREKFGTAHPFFWAGFTLTGQ